MSRERSKLVLFPPPERQEDGAVPDVEPDAELNPVLRRWTAPPAGEDLDARILQGFRDLQGRHAGRRLHRWARRVVIGAASVALIASGLWMAATREVLQAAELLERSAASDAARMANPEAVIHRVSSFEHRRLSDGRVIARRRIESWRRGQSRIEARRVVDERNSLVVGEWVRADGSRQRRQAGVRPEWSLMEPSAESFLAMVPPSSVAALSAARMTDGRIAITYHAALVTDGMDSAEIVLSGTDCHPVSQAVRVRQQNDLHEFRVTEVTFESLPVATVGDDVFEPEPGLLANMPTAVSFAAPRSKTPGVRADVLIAMEVTALERLDRVGALLGREAQVTRAQAGRLGIEALVQDEARKRTLIDTLDALARAAPVKVDIRTFADAQSGGPSPPISAPRVVSMPTVGPFAAYDHLRRYFLVHPNAEWLRRGAEVGIDAVVHDFAQQALVRSSLALQHAGVLRDLVERFTAADSAIMDDATRATWRRLVGAHALDVQRQTEALRLMLEPIFFQPASGGVMDEATLLPEVAVRLFDQVVAHDDSIRAAFAASPRAEGISNLLGDELQQSLRTAERRAIAIARPE